jgi:hypothetical protein
MREPQMGEEALVQGLCMLPSASEPGDDAGLTGAEDAFSRASVQPLGQRRQHDCALVRRSLQPVQGSGASSTQRGAASLTTQRLDPLSMTRLAIPKKPHEWVNL